MIYTLESASEGNTKARWVSLILVIGLHLGLVWGLWNTEIRYAIEQSTPLFVSLIAKTPPKEEPTPEPPIPDPVKPKPVIEPPLPKPQQIVSEEPVQDVAEFTAPPPDPVPVEPEPAPVIEAAPVIEQVSLPELAVACPERSPPVYPVWSKRMREQGEVVLQVFLDNTGRVVRTEINRTSGSPRLDEAALQAVQRWRCRPATKDGRPVSAVALQSINFVIN
ncbi:MAG: energy transducer TonB [Gammaproteobacteria bacterium]|nr:energy transducer TonB [Gammaproteobacteria bacterium]